MKANFETRRSLHRLQALKPGGFKLWVTTGFDWYSPHRERRHALLVVAVPVEVESRKL
jgi:hypothetical protein